MDRRTFFKSGLVLPSAIGLSALSMNAHGLDLCADDASSKSSDQEARLRSAENPEGAPQSALEAAQREFVNANRYPKSIIAEFRQKIATANGLTPEHVVIGAGSIELMINTGLLFGKPGRSVLSGDPTWATTMLYAEANGADWIKVPLTSDYYYDFDAMRGAVTDKVDLVYICHPNNPTGLAEEHDKLEAFVKEMEKKCLVIVDEAFIDCLPNAEKVSMKKLLPKHKNVIVSRTFSKLWGMAGFRVGYMLGDPSWIQKLESTIPGLEMQSRIGVAAAIAAFDDEEYIERGRKNMREAAKTIFGILDSKSLKYIRSDSNFISFQVQEPGTTFVEKMMKHNVSLKPVVLNDNDHWVRVSCGSPEELKAFAAALDHVVS